MFTGNDNVFLYMIIKVDGFLGLIEVGFDELRVGD